MQQVEKRLYPGKLSTFFPMEMVPGLSEQPFQRCLQLQHIATIATICNKVEKYFSGQIEYVLSNGNGPECVWTTVSPLAAVATSCNNCNNMQQSRKYFIRANRVRSFQWKWSQVCVKNRCKADGSCNILQWVFPLSSELSLFIQLADRSHPRFLCWNPLVACCLEFIDGCNRATACNNFQYAKFLFW